MFGYRPRQFPAAFVLSNYERSDLGRANSSYLDKILREKIE